MRRLLYFLAAIVSAACMTGCFGSSADPYFLSYDENALQVAGVPQFSWDEKTCQMSFSRDSREFRVFTDTMSDFYCVKMSTIPTSAGQSLSCDLTWTTPDDISTRSGMSFRVEQISPDGTVWLWNRKEKIGVIVQILE